MGRVTPDLRVPSRRCREYNCVMSAPGENTDGNTGERPRLRQPGWVALLFVLAIACLTIGGMLLGMMQAPIFPRKLVAVGWICMAVGLVLIPIAWSGRRRHARLDREFKD